MAPRPTWKGYLKLSLVSCAVAMYTATSTSSRIRLNIINRETGNRIRNQAIDSETGDVVENESKVKGYEVDDGQYVLLEEEELDEVALEVHPHDRHRVLRAARGGGRDLSRRVLLHRAGRRGRLRGVRGDPRGDEEEGHGRARARGDAPARAAADAAAARQGDRRDRAALQARGARRGRPISTTSRTSKCRPTCSSSPSTFSSRRRAISIRTSSRIATRTR